MDGNQWRKRKKAILRRQLHHFRSAMMYALKEEVGLQKTSPRRLVIRTRCT